MKLEKKTSMGIAVILFFLTSWSFGNLMTYSPRVRQGSYSLQVPTFLIWIILIFLLAFFAALFYKIRSTTLLVAIGMIIAIMVSPYLVVKFGFLWGGLILFTLLLTGIMYWKGYNRRRLLVNLSAALILGCSIIIIYLFGPGIGGYLESGGGSGGEAPEILPWDDPGSAFEGAFGSMGNFILIFIIGSVLGFLLLQKFGPKLISRKEEEKDKGVEEEISSTVDKAISELYEGKDVESTVLRCYQRMSTILEERGVRDEDFITPREFETKAIKNLEVKTQKIVKLRELFELAKYSDHLLGGKERSQAVKALKELRKELN
ncbi:MAG: DUF4129 domain-containing protein [Candidatus Thermoplasmatota archaeon]|nr:DUF4129 domain-containing protein [Candidatus Thermoplasmatota archaeon]